MVEREFTHASWAEFLAEGKLMGVRCRACGALSAVPRPLCPACRAESLEWVELSGRGAVEGFTVIHVPPTPLAAGGYGRDRPYASAVVRLDEGPWITAQLVGVDPQRPESLRVGMRVRAEVVHQGEAVRLGFRPEG